ncbi:hypothetical protein BH11MYX3_BH11MYX3_46820 [soil metagenome]
MTKFLNVDLEIAGRSSLEPLAAELSPRMFALYRGLEGKLERAHYETRNQYDTAEQCLRNMLRVLGRMGPKARACWRAASVRDFNVGVQSGAKPFLFEVPISAATLAAVAKLGARIVLTVYAPTRKK